MSQNFTRLLYGFALLPLLLGAGVFFNASSLHAQGLQVSIGSATVAQGAEVCVPVRVSNFTNILGMEFTITYDPARLTFKSVRNFNLAGLTESNSFGLPGQGLNQPGRIKVSWLDPNVTGITIANNTAIFEICFTAANADAATILSFASGFEAYDGAERNVTFIPQSGTITIGAGGGGTGGGGTGGGGTGGGGTGGGGTGGGGTGGGTIGTGTFTLDISDTTVMANQPFCLNVKAGSFRDILGMEMTINYNATALAFDSIARYNLAGLNSSAFGLPGQGTNQPGAIKLSWIDPNVAGVSIPDSTVIFAMCFRAITNNVTTNVTFAANAEVVNKDENFVPFNGVAGRVVVGTGGSGSGGGTTGPVTLTIGSATVQNGQQFCLPVTATNFTNILGMEFTITYDPTRLQFQTVDNLNLAGLTLEGSFGLPGMGSNPVGTMKVSWNDPEAVGKSVNNGTALFRVCFTATGSNTTTNVGFSNVSEVIGAGDVILPLTRNAGTVTITGTGGGGGSNNFALVVGNKSSPANQEVCLDVKVAKFTQILGMEFTVNYNPAVLNFARVTGFNLNGLNESSFGLPGVGLNQPGSIKVSWVDPNVTGVTISDSTSIFQVCFTPVGANGTTTPVTINPQLEITNAGEESIPVTIVNGSVTITSGGGSGSNAFALVVGNKTAPANQEVCLDVKVANFRNILGMEFTLNYNPTILNFRRVTGFNLTGLNESSFGLPGVGLNQPGAVKVSWVDPNVTGVTLSDSTSIFMVCFTPVGANGVTTPVTINPQLEITNANEQPVPATLVNGGVTIGTAPQPGGQLIVAVESKTAAPNSDVCLNVSVENFNGIVGMEYNLAYNTDSLTFKSVGAFNLAGLNETNFGLPGVGVNPAGNIKLSWVDPNVTGITLTGKVNIFQVCFTVKANSGVARVRFDTQKTIEITNAQDQQVPRTLTNGFITIQNTVQPPAIAAPAQVTNVNCFGASTGAINITVSGGSGNYSYLWNFQNANTQDLSNIPAGTYSVTVTDVTTQLTATQTYTVTQPAAALQIASTAQNAACAGVNTGQISLNVTGGTGPYTYAWSNGLPANLATQTNLAGGTYQVTVTDALGCSANTSVQVGQNPAVVIGTIQPTFIDNGNDGAVNIGVSGGTTPYSFAWSGPGGYANTTEDISGLNAVGQYCVTVTDNLGCKDTACVNILQRLKFGTVTIRQACAGSSDGTISVNPTGGQSPYTFRWSNGSSTQNLSNLAPGSYGLTITDALNTSISGNFQVMGLTAIVLNGNVTPARGASGVANGSITLNVSGGDPGYTYSWSNGATTASVSGLAAGEYCVTVTDENGCSAQRCFQVEFQALPLAFNPAVTNNRCFGEMNGLIRLTVSGGVEPFFATFNDGVRVNANSNGVIERGSLPAGTYTFVIADAQGTTIQGTANITQPTAISVSQITVRHDNENAGCTGSISLAPGGGTAPYNVRWNSNNAGALITNLCEGAYVPTVEDANGCVQTFDPIQVNTFGFTGSTVDNQCPGDETGDINLAVSGGAMPYTYAWVNSRGDTIARTKDLSNVLAGTYRAVVREQSGNMLMKQFTLNTLSNISATVQISSNYRGYAVSCQDASDGIAMATGLNGIGNNYMYEWLLNDQLVGSQQRLQNAKAGVYVVRVTDQGGCMTEANITLNAPPPVGLNGSVNSISCTGARDGDVLVSASGGVPGSIYSYRWSTGGTGPRISFLPPGNYSVTVTDANSCAATAMFNVQEPQPLSVAIETTPATTGAPDCNGAARVTVTGGTRPYVYLSNVPGARLTDSVFLKLCPGDYILQLRDARGCRTTPEQITFNILDRTLPCLDMRTVISPDGDGANDNFEIRCIDELKDNRVMIFNQWGQMVFETLNYSNNWDGRASNGEQLPEGAYYFVLEYTDIDGNRIQSKGSITLLRQ